MNIDQQWAILTQIAALSNSSKDDVFPEAWTLIKDVLWDLDNNNLEALFDITFIDKENVLKYKTELSIILLATENKELRLSTAIRRELIRNIIDSSYARCGGCGVETPIKRCLGCRHEF